MLILDAAEAYKLLNPTAHFLFEEGLVLPSSVL